MTPQAKALRSAVAAAVGPGKVDAALRAVVSELGITDEMVDGTATACGYRCKDRDDVKWWCASCEAADALDALLEASGADR